MLQLKNITKHYITGDIKVTALSDVSLSFRDSEFVSILGPSGCGKTTLLNIIGGLDRYTSGDIIINGRSTKDFKDKDWDNYRNHSIGFVFQSYNLIPHQSVLKNVELALTLSGIKRDERRERAKQALEKVGLGDQLNKKPNQMSGGQMQRVAIARAIVNNPDIILADEPTGALDTETSIQVMEILKELSKTKLVIMVTHNPELAKQYSTRIINLSDGQIKGDTMPQAYVEEQPKAVDPKEKKPSMSLLTAFSLSLNNLITKKARTILTSFAGSIGIIGIALILSLSAGFNGYIARVQNETLMSYPLTVQQVSVDFTTLIETMLGTSERDVEKYPDTDEISTQNAISEMVTSISSSASRNDLASFKKHLDENLDKSLYSDLKYSYGVDFRVYKEQTYNTSQLAEKTTYTQVYPTALPDLKDTVPPAYDNQTMQTWYYSLGSLLTSQPVWGEIIGGQKSIENQYEFIDGHYPDSANEIMIVVDEYNQISDLTLYQIGLLTAEDISYLFNEMVLTTFGLPKMQDGVPVLEKMTKEEAKTYLKKTYDIERTKQTFTFKELREMTYSVAVDSDRYKASGETANLGKEGIDTKLFIPKTDEELQSELDGNSTIKLKISGIARLKEGVTNGGVYGTIGYTKELTDLLIEKHNDSEIVKEYVAEKAKAEQRAQVDRSDTLDQYFVNLYTGDAMTEDKFNKLASKSAESDEKIIMFINALTSMREGLVQAGANETQLAIVDNVINQINALLGDDFLAPLSIGFIDTSSPSAISIYPTSFESKDEIIDFINEYNDEVPDEKEIKYTDFIGMMMSSITTIVNAITYILIAFVSISLVVSSIMIGIITYISVLERTKEIGVLRSIGASKRDIKRVFNAETMLIGFSAGMLGIIVTLLLNIPINLIIKSLSGIAGVASLPLIGGISLVVISVLLTTIAGLLPASLASKKDPVIALRTE